jgi:hypothetical protein
MKCHIQVLLFVDEMTSKVLIKYFHHKESEHYPCTHFFFIFYFESMYAMFKY